MYNQKVIDRLKNLTYLSSLSKKNISVISKANEFGDIVKFMAQINKEDVVQKIRFKATGCSHFIALCSYFCEIVEGKSVAEALKIKEKDLVKFDVLDDSRQHVYPIILNTFALLIKKYRKGIEKGLIEPCEVIIEDVKVKVKREKKVNVNEGLDEILVAKTRKIKKENVSNEKTIETTTIEVKTEKIVEEEVKNQESSSSKKRTSKKKVADDLALVEKSEKTSIAEENITEKATNIEVVEAKTNKVKKSTKKDKVQKVAEKVELSVDNKEEVEVIETAGKDNEIVLSDADVVVIDNDVNNVIVEDANVSSVNSGVMHTKVEHKKTVSRKRTVKIGEQEHTDESFEHTEVNFEQVSNNPAEISVNTIQIANNDLVEKEVKQIEIKKEPKVKKEKVKKEKKEPKAEKNVKVEKKNVSANDTKAEHLKKLQLGLSVRKTEEKSVESKKDIQTQENKAKNLNSMLSKLNAKHQEQGATVITTTHQRRVEITKTEANKTTEAKATQTDNLLTMRNSLSALRKQNTDNQNTQKTVNKEKTQKAEKVKREKPQKPEKVKKEKAKPNKNINEDGVEVVYLDEESKEKKGFFSRLFRK